eukprot:SAG22_NODE_1425_length_4459_cov_5.864220_2_plen_167_part_00
MLLASSFCAALQQLLCCPSAAFLPRPAGFGVIGVIGVTILKIAIACLDRPAGSCRRLAAFVPRRVAAFVLIANLLWCVQILNLFCLYITNAIRSYRHPYYTTKIRVPCDCSKGYHLFGSAGDQNSYRSEFRGMHGHGCSKYTDGKIHIDQSTLKVQNLPATKFRKK